MYFFYSNPKSKENDSNNQANQGNWNNKNANEDKYSELVLKYKQLLAQLEEQKKINKLLGNENYKLKNKLNSYNELNHDYNEAINKNKSLDTKLKQINENFEYIEKENIKLKNTINEGQTKEEFLDKLAEEYYDAIIEIDSINSLRNEGWEIKYNKERKETYQKIINEETIKIGVLGLNNVGKSYLLSKIANSTIPTGYSIETKGISIKYSQGDKGEEKGICILDSEGFETPLLREDDNLKEDKIIEKKQNDEAEGLDNWMKNNNKEDILSKDKTQTERFIEHLIISLSDMIILVIGKLTRTEQRLITRIKNMAKNNENRIKSIIIVHNLAQYNKKREIENHIESYLKRSATFNLKQKNVFGIKNYEDRFYFVEDFEKDSNFDIFHYLMAREGTEAGEYYNDLTLKLIRQQYNCLNQRNRIDIPKKIKDIFCKLSNDIIGEKIDMEQLETINENKIKLKNGNNKNDNKNLYLDNFKIQDAYIDQDGNYLQSKVKFEPRYSLYVYRETKVDEEDDYENFLLLRIEIPGNVTKLTARSTNKDEKYKGIVINGYKEEDEIPENTNKENFQKIYDNRKYKEISYFIELKGNIALNKKHPIQDTEIYKIHFNKKNKEKFFVENNQKHILKEDVNNNKIVEGEKIGCGVYILKFSLTQNSLEN